MPSSAPAPGWMASAPLKEVSKADPITGFFPPSYLFCSSIMMVFYNDLQSGTPVGRSNTNIIRPTIVFKPSTNLVLSLMGEIGHDYGDESVAFNIFDPTTNITKQGYVPPAGKFDVRLNTHGNSDLKWKHAVANIDWGIGAGTISSVTGLRSVSHDHYQDSDGSPVVALEALNSVRQHQFFQELRYAGKPFGTDAISITAGGNYSTSSIHRPNIEIPWAAKPDRRERFPTR